MTGISRTFGAVRALDGVNFELRRGEVMALLGENGAGKSTLSKIIAGVEVADDGKVEIDGQAVLLGTSAHAQRLGIAVVQQEFGTIPSMSVADNLFIGSQRSSLWWFPRRVHRRAMKLLADVGLAHVRPSQLVEELSVAERQLLEIARVLAQDARIIIFDEPTATLSDADITKVLQIVRQLASRGISIVYVTHRLGEVFALADRITIMRNGRSLPPFERSETSADSLVTAMLGRELGTLFPDRQVPTGTEEPVLEVLGLDAPGLAAPVSFTVRRGEILGITGQIGSGASETLAALAGMIPGARGTVRVRGAAAKFSSRLGGLRAGIAYCSPDRKADGIFADLPLVENLSSAWLKSTSTAGVISPLRERSIAQTICEQFTIDSKRLRSPISVLSGGNQQKAVIAKWLGDKPAVLLVEEPTRGVDIGARAEIYAHLRALCDDGVGVVLVSTDSSEILGLADHIGTFHQGRAGAIRPFEDWTEQSLLSTVMHTTVTV